MNFDDLLPLSEAHLVRIDEELKVLITWNGSATFNVFDEELDNFNVFSASEPVTREKAEQMIENHLQEMRRELTENEIGV